MTLRVPYIQVPTATPVYCLGGALTRPRPIIPITLVGPGGSWACDALVDSGADDTVFPDWVAQRIGIDLSSAPSGRASGVLIGSVSVRYAEVELRLTDGQEYRTWLGCVGFAGGGFQRRLLGHAGVLRYFSTCTHGDILLVEMTVNATYPGT